MAGYYWVGRGVTEGDVGDFLWGVSDFFQGGFLLGVVISFGGSNFLGVIGFLCSHAGCASDVLVAYEQR